MYTAFYGLREKPFSLTPNPRFLYLAESHREALAHLLYGLEQGEGFIVVSGEVGTGKTTICRTLLERLGAETELAFLFNPSGSADEMLQSVNEEYGLPAQGLSRRELLSQLNRFLLEKNRESKRVVLIIDEAQNLSTTTLEQVRLLSNLETTSSKLIQIILLGQPELAVKLDSPELRQLRQRIGVRWQLSPLSARETAEYVKHRLRVSAGAERGSLFNDAALKEVHRRSSGVPRLVNVLCDRALLAGYAVEAHCIDADLVKQAAQEIRDLRDGAFGARETRAHRPRWWLAPAAAALAALALVGGVWLGSGGAGDRLRAWITPGDVVTPSVSAAPAGDRSAADSADGVAALPDVSSRGPASAAAAAASMTGERGWPTGWEVDPGDAIESGAAGAWMSEAESAAAVVDADVDAAAQASAGTDSPSDHEDDLGADPYAAPDPAESGDAFDGADAFDEGDAMGAETLAPGDGAGTGDLAFPGASSDALLASETGADAADGSFLAYLLAQVTPGASRAMAVAEILRVWGRPEPETAPRDEASALDALRAAGLQVYALRETSLEELARLDHPSLLALRDARGQTHWVALTELRPSVAFLAGLAERGAIGVSYPALEQRWDGGRAYVVWSSEIGLGRDGLLRAGSAGESVRWVQQALVELGYLAGLAIEEPAVYDMPTRRSVERFQRAQGLRQDGVTGPLTLMRLDDALGRSDRPRLGQNARGEAG